MLSAGDSGRSVMGGRAGVDGVTDSVETEPVGHRVGEFLIDVEQVAHHAHTDLGRVPPC